MNTTLLLAGVTAAIVAGATLSTSGAVTSDPQPLQFRPFSEFEARGVGRLGIRVDGWKVTKPPAHAFPASFWANVECSATLVGEEVLVSVAHCFKNAPEVGIELDFAPFQGLCDTASNITGGTVKVDFAVCRMTKAVPATMFETVNVKPTPVKKGDAMILTGFGGSAAHPFGTYLVGGTTVSAVEGWSVVTRDGAWTREGDSGGAGFAPTGNKRRLVSVNATVNKDLKTSRATLLAGVYDVIKDWQRTQRKAGHRVLICGIDANAPRCHR